MTRALAALAISAFGFGCAGTPLLSSDPVVTDPAEGDAAHLAALLIAEIAANRERFDITRRAPALSARPILLVAGTRDRVTPLAQHHAPMAAALVDAGATDLRARVLDADHAYSSRRIALARTVVAWLAEACGG